MYLSRNGTAEGEFKARKAKEEAFPKQTENQRKEEAFLTQTESQRKEEAFLTQTENKRLELWRLIPDFPAFEDMMRIASELPHPAIVTAKQQKVMRATSLANLTLQINEMIFGVLCQKAKMNSVPGITTIRCTDTASIVYIKRNAKSKNSIHIESKNGKKIRDRATESPEVSTIGLITSRFPCLRGDLLILPHAKITFAF
jgi:hypothetical protein